MSGQSSPYSEAETDGVGGGFGGLGMGDTLAPVFHESRDKRKVKKFLKEMDKDLNRIRDKQTEFEPVIEESFKVETRKFPLKATQIPSEDPGIVIFLSSSFHKICRLLPYKLSILDYL